MFTLALSVRSHTRVDTRVAVKTGRNSLNDDKERARTVKAGPRPSDELARSTTVLSLVRCGLANGLVLGDDRGGRGTGVGVFW